MTTAAAIDRLVHHATILELTGSSYRSEAAQRRNVAVDVTAGNSHKDTSPEADAAATEAASKPQKPERKTKRKKPRRRSGAEEDGEM